MKSIAVRVNTGRVPELSKRVPHVLKEIVEHGQSLLVAVAVLDRFDRSERENRLASRFFRRHACPGILRGLHLEMSPSSSLNRASSPRLVVEREKRLKNRRTPSRQVLRSDIEEPCDQCRRFLPTPCFGPELPASGRGQPVETRASIVVGRPPLRGNGALLLESQSSG